MGMPRPLPRPSIGAVAARTGGGLPETARKSRVVGELSWRQSPATATRRRGARRISAPTAHRGDTVSAQSAQKETFAVANTADNPTENTRGTTRVKRGMAEQLKNGVIMDVVTPDQAK